MATEFNGIVYFPTKATFFEGAVSESLEAKYGIKGPYLVNVILFIFRLLYINKIIITTPCKRNRIETRSVF